MFTFVKTGDSLLINFMEFSHTCIFIGYCLPGLLKHNYTRERKRPRSKRVRHHLAESYLEKAVVAACVVVKAGYTSDTRSKPLNYQFELRVANL
jgi:hypothetical protein